MNAIGFADIVEILKADITFSAASVCRFLSQLVFGLIGQSLDQAEYGVVSNR